MEFIYVVYEMGEGSIHLSFKHKAAAQAYVSEISEKTQMNCYEIITVPFIEENNL
jgi:hypothetical protein